MLEALTIQNIATLSQVDLEFAPGLTAITGDTGAGKSLLLDALELALGERADASLVRTGTERAQITASFRVGHLPETQAWLAANDFDPTDELILRRTVTAEGRSKATVNGTPVTLAQLKALADSLVQLHSQHAHQQLLEPRTQTALLDAYADGGRQRARYEAAYRAWREASDALRDYEQTQARVSAEQDLLTFQVEELSGFQAGDGEYAALDQAQRQLAGADQFRAITTRTLEALDGDSDPGVVDQVERLRQGLAGLTGHHSALAEAYGLLEQAGIALDEATRLIRRASDQFEADPRRLAEVEARLSEWLQLARKHRIEPEQLAEHTRALSERLAAIRTSAEALPALRSNVETTRAAADQEALTLTGMRQEASASFRAEVTANLAKLQMPDAHFSVEWTVGEGLGSQGAESALFVFTPNPGQAGGPLSKIASGGELSRVSLAIEVITATKRASPTLVFDEVDVGIGGTTAAKVGQMLKALAAHAQLLVVTHQPQVAAAAHVHLHVAKASGSTHTESQAIALSIEERTQEIARMLGGSALTETTYAMARELLATS